MWWPILRKLPVYFAIIGAIIYTKDKYRQNEGYHTNLLLQNICKETEMELCCNFLQENACVSWRCSWKVMWRKRGIAHRVSLAAQLDLPACGKKNYFPQ